MKTLVRIAESTASSASGAALGWALWHGWNAAVPAVLITLAGLVLIRKFYLLGKAYGAEIGAARASAIRPHR